MQKQKGLVDTLATNLHSENGSMSNDATVECQISWESLQASSQSRKSDYWSSSIEHGGRTAEWCFGESSSAASRFGGVSDERKLEIGLRNSCSEKSYQEQQQQDGLSRASFLDVSDISSSNCQRNGFLFLRSSGSEALNQDLNADFEFEDEDENVSASMATESPDHAHRSSELPSLISGCSLDSQRMPHKRKASESSMGHSARSSDCSKRAERRQWHAQDLPQASDIGFGLPLPTENAGSESIRLVGTVSANSSLSNASDHAEASDRSLNLAANHLRSQDNASGCQFLTGVDGRNLESSSSEHSSRLSLQNYLFGMSLAPRLGSGSHHTQPVMQTPPSLGSHQSRWATASSRRSSSNSSGSGGRNAALLPEITPRNASRTLLHPMSLASDGFQNSPDQSNSWSSSAGGHLQPGANAGSTFRTGLSTSPLVSSSSLSRCSSSRYHQRLTELQRSLYSARTGSQSISSSSNNALQANSTTSEVIAPIPTLPDRPSRRASAARSFERPLGAVGVNSAPFPMRTLPPVGEGRRSIMSEQIRHVLSLMRRGESLRIEDMMILDHSVLLGMADLHDRHHDMRMDVDNMSYEELLALEERIGNVCTGLSEEAIAKHLKSRKYIEILNLVNDSEQEPCCICREEYNMGEDIGQLDCGHDFHTNCIKQWLLQKNLCPICKTTGLKT